MPPLPAMTTSSAAALTVTASVPSSPKAQVLELIKERSTVMPAGTADGRTELKTVPLTWTPPNGVTPEMKETAAAMAAAAETGMRPATMDELRDWLTTVGAMTAGNLTREDAAVKVSAYVTALDEVPVGVIGTPQALRRAGQAFKFFPTFQEVDAFLRTEAERYLESTERMRQVAAAPLAMPAPAAKPEVTPEERRRRWREDRKARMTPEERENHEAIVSALKEGRSIIPMLKPMPGTVRAGGRTSAWDGLSDSDIPRLREQALAGLNDEDGAP